MSTFPASSSWTSTPFLRPFGFKSISNLNTLGYIPLIGTIAGIVRVAFASLNLIMAPSSAQRYQALGQLTRGFIEILPVVGTSLILVDYLVSRARNKELRIH